MRFFNDLPGVAAFISERRDGPFSRFADIFSGRRRGKEYGDLLSQNGLKATEVVGGVLVHGDRVIRVSRQRPGIRCISGADGLVTTMRGIFLAVTVADCFPVFFYDPVVGAIGIAHVGWRGVVRGIVPRTVAAFARMKRRPRHLRVAIGPGIRSCHFFVRDDVISQFRPWPQFVRKRRGSAAVDLAGIIKAQLRKAGITAAHIEEAPFCTYTSSQRFFSHRRSERTGEPEARMAALIGLV